MDRDRKEDRRDYKCDRSERSGGTRDDRTEIRSRKKDEGRDEWRDEKERERSSERRERKAHSCLRDSDVECSVYTHTSTTSTTQGTKKLLLFNFFKCY